MANEKTRVNKNNEKKRGVGRREEPTRESENVKVRLLRLIDSRHKNKNNYITFIAEEKKDKEKFSAYLGA